MAKILIVDDDQNILSVICQCLQPLDFQVDTAYDSIEARDCLEHSQYDAILSDFRMPGETGLDLLSHVSCRFPGLPFILMTGNHSFSLKQQSIQMGGSGYLVKPFQMIDLVSTLKTVLGESTNQDKNNGLG